MAENFPNLAQNKTTDLRSWVNLKKEKPKEIQDTS